VRQTCKFRPRLETLEDRIVPDALRWQPQNNTSWNTPGNWWDLTQNAVSQAAPTDKDSVIFDNGWLFCDIIDTEATCHQITTTANWNGGTLNLSGGTLNIEGGVSNFTEGNIVVDTTIGGNGTVNVDGGAFTYSNDTLNNRANQGALDFWIGGGGAVYLTTMVTVGASFHVGYSTSDHLSADYGSLSMYGMDNCSFTDNTSIKVSQGGVFGIPDNSTVSHLNMSCSGTLSLVDGSTLSAANDGAFTFSNGGLLLGPDTGTATLNGNVSLDDSTLRMGTPGGGYSTLVISGALTLTDASTLEVDVNAASLTQCDTVQADSVVLDDTDTLVTDTAGDIAAGDHSHVVLSAANGVTGSFGVVAFEGNGTTWVTQYPGTQVILTSPSEIGIGPPPPP